MTVNGYTRQSSAGLITGGTILASLFNNEYNQIQSAFDVSAGHTHDGTVGGGQAIPTAGLSGLTNSSAGMVVASANALLVRTLTGTSGTITVTNGTGVSGNPTLTIDTGYIGQSSITTLGTIGTGVWNGTTIAVANGGTGATTASSARTNLGLAIGTNVEAWNATLDTVAAGTYTGASSITTLGTIGTGVWNGTILTGTYGGTGVNNASKTITLGGNVSTAGALTTSGAFGITLTATNTTSVTLPTAGTLSTLAGGETLTNKTINTPVLTVNANAFTIRDIVDTTKTSRFDASGITTGTNRVYTLPDISDTLTTITATQTLTNKTIAAGNNTISGITEAMQTLADNTTGNVSISAHGYTPKAPNDTTKFLRGDATWATISSSIVSVKRQTFTSSGTYTPSTGMLYCDIEIWGAGGGGGGVSGGAGFTGAGGGAGGYSKKVVTSATIGASQTVTIGAGGTAGANTGGTGGTGGTTSVGAIVSVTGGVGGVGASSNTISLGGVGGVGSSGDINMTGAPGFIANGVSAGAETSGSGGNTSLGGAGAGIFYTSDTVGNTAAANSGSGGSGAASNGAAHVGGVGAKGFVTVTEYCSQ